MLHWKTFVHRIVIQNINKIINKNLDTKKYIGGVFSATYTSPKLLAVGMYFLLPEYRGLGLGLPLWDRAIAGDVENKALIAGL